MYLYIFKMCICMCVCMCVSAHIHTYIHTYIALHCIALHCIALYCIAVHACIHTYIQKSAYSRVYIPYLYAQRICKGTSKSTCTLEPGACLGIRIHMRKPIPIDNRSTRLPFGKYINTSVYKHISLEVFNLTRIEVYNERHIVLNYKST